MTLNQECESKTVSAASGRQSPSVNTETVMEAIRAYAAAVLSDPPHFTTLDIALYMKVSEYPVRAAFTWLARYRFIEVVPGVRSKRYRSINADRRLHGNDYPVSIYRIREQSGEVDFNALMGVFCRG